VKNSQGSVKLSDFGISKELETTTGFSNTSIGSFRYMSPERLLGERYDSSADIWSVGLTLLELWNKAYPFRVRSPIELSTEVQHFDVRRFLRNGSRALLEIMCDMLQYEPSQRSPCLNLTRHRWFQEQNMASLEDAHMVSRQ
jgi:serine/threonine protein kinase